MHYIAPTTRMRTKALERPVTGVTFEIITQPRAPSAKRAAITALLGAAELFVRPDRHHAKARTALVLAGRRTVKFQVTSPFKALEGIAAPLLRICEVQSAAQAEQRKYTFRACCTADLGSWGTLKGGDVGYTLN